MKERPILFSGAMIRALLARTKRQTRRVFQVQRRARLSDELPVSIHPDGKNGWIAWFGKHPVSAETTLSAYPNGGGFKCPYGQPGDRLWVREAYRLCAEADATPPRDTDAAYRIWYEADAPHQPGAGRLRPGIHMPRWASRLTLEVAAVRVERLQHISEADAQAEGIERVGGEYSCSPWRNYRIGQPGEMSCHCSSKARSYMTLWESINGPGSWDANPWVWVIEFKRVTA